MANDERLLVKTGDFQDWVPAVSTSGFLRRTSLHAVLALQEKLNARARRIDDGEIRQAIAIEVSGARAGGVPVEFDDLRAVEIQGGLVSKNTGRDEQRQESETHGGQWGWGLLGLGWRVQVVNLNGIWV